VTNHPNQFAIGQPVLFVQRSDPRGQWQAGTVTSVTAVSSLREEVPYADTYRQREEAKKHSAECEGFLYQILPDTGDPNEELVSKVCTCRWLIADADASGRWRDTPMIAERRQFQLLWTDTGGDLSIDSSNTPLEETDIVHLSRGDASAEVDTHDLLKWAATPGGEG
jgi:hypothetical protein